MLKLNPLVQALRTSAPVIALGGLVVPFAALANPSGAQVIHGSVGITSPAPGGTVITQNSNAAIVNWQQFSIGGNEYVQFQQPSASAAILNRVIGGAPSEILGDLSANGRVFLINPQGVMFGAGSRVDVGGLFASTLDIADEDFIAGRYVFAGGSGAGVSNAGHISAADGGFVVLTGDRVENTGLIQARLGSVVLASGAGVSVELGQNGLIGFEVDAASASSAAGVDNLGEIVAQGGSVLMTAQVAQNLARSAVNNSGRIAAQGIEERNGEIFLTANADVTNSGELDASGYNGGTVLAIAGGTLTNTETARIDVSADGGTGGFVELSGQHLNLRGFEIVRNGGGHLLIDPLDLTLINGESGSAGTDEMTYTDLEYLLQNGGTSLYGQNSVVFTDIDDNLLDGVGTSGYGGSLYVYTSGCASNPCSAKPGGIYVEGEDDIFNIAGALDFYAGGYGGSMQAIDIKAQALNAGSGLSLQGSQIAARDLNSGGTISLYASNGNIVIDGSVAAVGGNGDYYLPRASVEMLAYGGTVSVTGDISARHDAESFDFSRAVVDIYGEQGVDIGGTVEAEGYGQPLYGGGGNLNGFSTDSLGCAEDSAACVIVGSSGTVNIDGNINARGIIAAASFPDSVYDAQGNQIPVERTVEAGNVQLSVYGSSIELGGLDVAGTGQVYAHLFANSGDVDPSTRFVKVNGDIQVVAANGREAVSESQSFSNIYSESTYGVAELVIEAQSESTAPAIAVDGDVTVKGPSALAALRTTQDVSIGGNVSVEGTGYTVNGVWRYLGSDFDPYYGADPWLDEGSGSWGSARLEIGDPDYDGLTLYAGAVNIGGAINVTGIGEASGRIFGGDLSVSSADVSASAGSQSGQWTEYANDSQYVHLIGSTYNDGEGPAVIGLANYGTAAFEFVSNALGEVRVGGPSTPGSLTVSGPIAALDISGVSTVEAGNVAVLGGTGEGAPQLVEMVFFPNETSIGRALTGGVTYADIEAGNTIQLGDVTVSGTGIVLASLSSFDTVSAGAVTVTAERGSFDSNDPALTDVGALSFGDAVVQIQAGSSHPAELGSLQVKADDHVHLGVQIVASGNVDVEAGLGGDGGAIDGTMPASQVALLDFLWNDDAGNEIVIEPPVQEALVPPGGQIGPIVLVPTQIEGADVTLRFTTASTLQISNLTATGALTIDGHNGEGPSLLDPVGTAIDWSGASISLSGVRIEDLSSLTLTASEGTLRLSDVDLDAAQVFLFAQDGNVVAEGSVLIDAGAIDVVALTGAIDLANATINVGDGTAVNGQDDALVTQIGNAIESDSDLAPLAPPAPRPNAAFAAGQNVSLGTLEFSGDGYLFVRADSAEFGSVVAGSGENALFYNFRPVDDAEDIHLPTTASLPFNASSVTLAYGGTDFSGDIIVDLPVEETGDIGGFQTLALLDDDANYVFMTAAAS
ncbi:MAG TPA: filamentous hemagglutinin N-terminal domain-containing protein, partial [Solimonas sp.]